MDSQPLDELTAQAAEGANIWASAVARGVALGGSEDRTRYELGDLALLVGVEYGADRMGQFARSINRPVNQIQEYRRVCRFYPRIVRGQVFGTCPRITYTHLRTAMRLNDLDRALAVLRAAQDGRWSSERLGEEVDRLRGRPRPPVKAWEGVVRAGTVAANTAGQPCITLVFLDATGEQFPQNQPLTLRVFISEEDGDA